MKTYLEITNITMKDDRLKSVFFGRPLTVILDKSTGHYKVFRAGYFDDFSRAAKLVQFEYVITCTEEILEEVPVNILVFNELCQQTDGTGVYSGKRITQLPERIRCMIYVAAENPCPIFLK